jgi:hypothetical protein
LIGVDQDQDLSRVFKQEVLSLVFSRWHCWGNQIMKQKPGRGGGGVESRDFTVSEGHGHPLVYKKYTIHVYYWICCDNSSDENFKELIYGWFLL